MKSSPKISIITATYNGQLYVEETIQSVINQTYPNIEYIIVDGASTDNTLGIIQKYHDKIATIISEPDQGIYDAFNKGIKAATGDIIYFLNSDDLLASPNIIAEIADIFSKDEHLSVVYGNVRVVDEKADYQYSAGKPMTLADFRQGEMCPHQGFFAKRDLFIKYGYFDLRYKIASDFDFAITCFKDQDVKAEYINKTVALFKTGGTSTDPRKQPALFAEKRDIITKHFGITGLPQSGYDVNGLYKIWLDILLLQKKGISNILHQKGIQKVAVFGTMKTAHYLWEDLQREGFQVAAFLDNNPNMQHQTVYGVEIQSPEWLNRYAGKVDAVLLSIESNRDLVVKEQLENLTQGQTILIYSWKDLIQMNLYMSQ